MSTSKNTIYKCPYCTHKYKEKPYLYKHMENEHHDLLGGLSPAQAYFNFKYKKDHGSCIMCKGNTKWNEQSERYERLCSDKCREAYRQMFRDRMIKKYGKDNLLNDPEMQKKMLKNRKISGTYTWSTKYLNKTYVFDYVGKLEKSFLEFMDIMMHWNPSDIMMPAPQIFYYEYEDKKHFYMPDVYITSINTIIEIKSFQNEGYRKRDIEVEKIKDQLVINSEFGYIKIADGEYEEFMDYLINYKNSNGKE